MAVSAYSIDILDQVMPRSLGWMEWDGLRFHPDTQDNTQLKAYELLLEFSIEYWKLWFTETMESKTADEVELL
jgi:hypothetical protein